MAYVLFLVLKVMFIARIIKFYIKFTTGWCKSNVCLAGKTAIVTGSNTGIGYETAIDFAKRGAKIILACRDRKIAEEAKTKIIEETANNNIVIKLLDLSSFQSVRDFAEDINKNENRLDILVNNEGVLGLEDEKSKDGHLTLMQTNYYSHFILTLLLINLLKKSSPSRVVNVSSFLAQWARNFNTDLEYQGPFFTYCNSKLCQIYFTQELAKKLQGSGVTTYSLHPGAVKTDIFKQSKINLPKMSFYLLKNCFFKTAEEGAQTTIYTSIAQGIEHLSGEHFHDCARVAPYHNVKSPGLGVKLWERSEKVVQLTAEEAHF